MLSWLQKYLKKWRDEELYSLTYGQYYLFRGREDYPYFFTPLIKTYQLDPEFKYKLFSRAVNHAVTSHSALQIRLMQVETKWRQKFVNCKADMSLVEIKGKDLE